jgi:hypothetical protein
MNSHSLTPMPPKEWINATKNTSKLIPPILEKFGQICQDIYDHCEFFHVISQNRGNIPFKCRDRCILLYLSSINTKEVYLT